jgi:UDP-N-acetylglucosamine 2-epimerase (non-hydrolysing)
MKILTVFGTRPEAIKMAPVIRVLHQLALARRSSQSSPNSTLPGVIVKTCTTAQHREMLDPILQLFGIRPDYDLDIMREDQSLAEITTNVLTSLEPVIAKESPDWILVQGDTTTAMAAALTAFYHHVKVGHVEAGLRTWNKSQPFPEEMNRKIVDDISDLHFAPTEHARQNLLREGIDSASIRVTGNTVIDALCWAAAQPFDLKQLRIPFLDTGTRSSKLILVTAHRRENQGAALENICMALREIAERYTSDVRIVYPVHMNPNVQEPVHRLLDGIPNITLLPPLEYLPMVHLLKRAFLVLTDSGGLQEEAPGLGIPVLVLRQMTERPEGADAGTVKVIGTERSRIVAETMRLIEDSSAYEKMAHAANPYGDGHAAEHIAEALLGD